MLWFHSSLYSLKMFIMVIIIIISVQSVSIARGLCSEGKTGLIEAQTLKSRLEYSEVPELKTVRTNIHLQLTLPSASI